MLAVPVLQALPITRSQRDTALATEPRAVFPWEAVASLGIRSLFLFLPYLSSLFPSLLLPWDSTLDEMSPHQLLPQALLSREPRPRVQGSSTLPPHGFDGTSPVH